MNVQTQDATRGPRAINSPVLLSRGQLLVIKEMQPWEMSKNSAGDNELNKQYLTHIETANVDAPWCFEQRRTAKCKCVSNL